MPMHYWPHEPPADAAVLVKARGSQFVSSVRKVLDENDVSYCMGGARRDEVVFYVPAEQLDKAKALFGR